MQRLPIQPYEVTHELLRPGASQRGVSMSALLRKVLREFLSTGPAPRRLEDFQFIGMGAQPPGRSGPRVGAARRDPGGGHVPVMLLDTSAIHTLAERSDPNFLRAVALFRQALHSREELLVHSYILVEAAALLQQRLGLEPGLRFLAVRPMPLPP